MPGRLATFDSYGSLGLPPTECRPDRFPDGTVGMPWGATLDLGPSRRGPFEGPATAIPPALPVDSYFRIDCAFGFVVLRGLRPAKLAKLASVHSGSHSCSQFLVDVSPHRARARVRARARSRPTLTTRAAYPSATTTKPICATSTHERTRPHPLLCLLCLLCSCGFSPIPSSNSHSCSQFLVDVSPSAQIRQPHRARAAYRTLSRRFLGPPLSRRRRRCRSATPTSTITDAVPSAKANRR